jgi:predicted porin
MKKSLLALAALSAFATAAQAQSSVSVYGILDMNVGTTKSESATAKQTIFNSSEAAIATSRLGFKGVEDLGGGLKVAFTLEGCLNPNNGTAGTGVVAATNTTTNRLFNREAQVEVSGKFGAVRFGTTDLLSTNNIMDGLINVNGNISNNATTDVGADSNQVVRYTSPAFNGLQVEVGYAGAQTDVNNPTTSGSFSGVGVMYVNGPVAVYASQAERNDNTTTDNLKQTMYGVKYNAGFATFAAGQSKWNGVKDSLSNGFTGYGFQADGSVSDTNSDDLTSTRIGVSVPTPMLGSGVATQLVYGKDDTETALAADAKIWNLSVTKGFSKRTTGYVSFRDTNYNKTTNNDTQKVTVGLVHAF